MARKGNGTSVETRPQADGQEARLPEVVDLLGKVDRLLREGQPGEALDLIARSGVKSPWATSALGVCQLRLGNAKVALDVFRGLALAAGGLSLRRDVPTVFKTNYATALLLLGNLAGGQSALHDAGDDLHPAVVKLREAIRRWAKGLTFWQRLNWWMGGEPAHPFALDYPPGDLE
jgi:hypothetical protein